MHAKVHSQYRHEEKRMSYLTRQVGLLSRFNLGLVNGLLHFRQTLFAFLRERILLRLQVFEQGPLLLLLLLHGCNLLLGALELGLHGIALIRQHTVAGLRQVLNGRLQGSVRQLQVSLELFIFEGDRLHGTELGVELLETRFGLLELFLGISEFAQLGERRSGTTGRTAANGAGGIINIAF